MPLKGEISRGEIGRVPDTPRSVITIFLRLLTDEMRSKYASLAINATAAITAKKPSADPKEHVDGVPP